MNDVFEAALQLASQGWTIFPGEIVDGQKKSHKSEKYSGTKWGATRDVEQVRQDWAKWPDALIGIPTGAINNVFVIDVDTVTGHDKDGFASLATLESKHGSLPPTLTAESPSGSRHYYFRHPGFPVISKANLFWKGCGIDVRGDGGMVIAPPSIKPDRGVYRWLHNLPIADAPPWILNAVREPERIASAAPTDPWKRRYDIEAARELYQWLADSDTLEGDDHWRQAGMAAKYEFGDEGLELWQIVAHEPLGRTAMARWDSFDGEGQSRSGKPTTLDTIVQIASRAGWTGSVRKSASAMFGDIIPTVSSPPLAPATPPKALIKSSAEFLQGFVPPDYILDGVLQRGFCYSMTAKTGTGKTAVAMCFSAHVATGRPLNGLSVAQGEVIYLAGENPTDIQMRWLGLTQEMEIDPASVPVYFLPGVITISQNVAAITREVEARALRPTLVVVDTAAAYFEGDNENDNVQQGNNARLLRSLTLLPGGPCVLILCHPTKNAQDDALVPRGGGAFLNEVDGNIALKANDTIIGAEVQGKFRGPAFSPLQFKLDAVREHPLLKDSKGRNIPTVIARAITDGEMASNAAMQECDENRLLRLIEKQPRASLQELANLMGAKTSKSKVDRLVQKLINLKILKREGRNLKLTTVGEKELNDVDRIVSPSFQAPFPGGAFPVLPTIKN